MRHVLLRASTLAVLVTLPTLAHAGPPLICHPFDIGTARSLPTGPADGGWSAIDPAYDRARLVADTLALLTPSTPTLVRMETLRRATMYVADDAAAAGRLLQALRERTSNAPATRDRGWSAGRLHPRHRRPAYRAGRPGDALRGRVDDG